MAALRSPGRLLVVSAEVDPRLSGGDPRSAASARERYEAYLPLLRRWGDVVAVSHPESRLDFALWQAARQGHRPLHLSFLPLEQLYLSSEAPNVAFVDWGYPDLPGTMLGDDLRTNLSRTARHLDAILASSSATRDALLRGGVRAPIAVLPPPLEDAAFALPQPEPRVSTRLDGPARLFAGSAKAPDAPLGPWDRSSERGLVRVARRTYRMKIKPRLPEALLRPIVRGVRGAEAAYRRRRARPTTGGQAVGALALAGVVYACHLDPFDPAQSWPDLLSAFLLALGDCSDATLVVQIDTPPAEVAAGIARVAEVYRGLDVGHACTLALQAGGRADVDALVRASTYVVGVGRTTGLCQPLRRFLAAGRPAIAPAHSLPSDDPAALGFIVASSPEPAPWPAAPSQPCATRWHRLTWQSLHDQLRASYRLATAAPADYRRLADQARAAMRGNASAEALWPRLVAALDEVGVRPGGAIASAER